MQLWSSICYICSLFSIHASRGNTYSIKNIGKDRLTISLQKHIQFVNDHKEMNKSVCKLRNTSHTVDLRVKFCALSSSLLIPHKTCSTYIYNFFLFFLANIWRNSYLQGFLKGRFEQLIHGLLSLNTQLQIWRITYCKTVIVS